MRLHLTDGHGLHIVGSDMHALHTSAFLIVEELYLGEILFLFVRSGLHGPVELLLRYEVREADHGDEMKVFLPGIIHLAGLRPPEALQGSSYG